MRKTILLLFFCALLRCPQTKADSWPHWRGNSGNGCSTSATPPTQWSVTKNVKWKAPIPGSGTGSPVNWKQKVFVVTAVNSSDEVRRSDIQSPQAGRPEQGSLDQSGFNGSPAEGLPTLQFLILCFDRNTGDIIWQRTAAAAQPHQETHATNGFASASPCTDGARVYAHFGSRGLYCYDMDGELKWKRDDFGAMNTLNGFGEGSSPTIEGDKIIVPWDHEGQSYLYALNKFNGETIWKIERDEPTCWSTPLVVQHEGRKQIVMNGQVAARAYDLETGQEVWRCGGQTVRPIASPVSANGMVYIGSGFRGAFLGAFRLDGQGDIRDTASVAWTIGRDTPDISSPLLSAGRLYFHKGKGSPLTCVDAATGRPHYKATRIPGLSTVYASPIAAGGHVYLTGRNGTTVVIKDADELEIVATNSIGEVVAATPAPVDNELFIRGEQHLFCIAE